MALAYTVEDTAKLIGIGKTRVYQEINNGRLVAKKFGKRTLIPHASIENWLNNLQDYTAANTHPE